MSNRLLLIPFLIAVALPASAQLTAAKGAPVSMGHHHLNVTDLDAHRKFWVDTLGGRETSLGSLPVLAFPEGLIFLREKAPEGGTKGSTVDHIGFAVPDVPAIVERVKEAGFDVVTQQEVSGGRAKSDVFHSPSQDLDLAFVMGPDDVKVELMEDPDAETPIRNHHIHMAANDVPAVQDWYIETFGGKRNHRGLFEEVVLPGVRVTFVPMESSLAGTKGRALDHIGFEVDGLEAFTQKLEAAGVEFDVPYRKVPSLGISIAFFTDPWGTYIELTEGLDKVE